MRILAFLLLLITSGTIIAQTYECDVDICVIEFNASWNSANGVDWLEKLSDVESKRINIDEGSWQTDFSIVVIPTIIIFQNGEEVERFQANIMMTMEATKKEVQDRVDEIIMSDF